MRRAVTLLLAVAAAVALAACSPSAATPLPQPLPFAPAGPNAAPDPSVLGPYPVGVRTVVLKDLRRVTTSSLTGARTPRTLVTEVWYPAGEESRGKEGRVYRIDDLLPPDLSAMIPSPRSPSLSLATSAVLDVAPRPGPEKFPLVVFSHGNGGVRMQSTYFTVFLASHGYVVAAPDHAGDTLADFIRRGRLRWTDVIDSYDDRTDDLRFLIDHFTSLDVSDPLHGRIDPSRIGTSGHSFGALTALRTAGIDRRVKAVVPHSPPGHTLAWIGVDRELDQLAIPILLVSGGLDRTLPPASHAATLWSAMGPPGWWLTLATAGHFTFSDLCVLDLESIQAASAIGIGNVIEDGCGPRNLPPTVAEPLIRHFSIALFNSALRGSTQSRSYLDAVRAPAVGESPNEVSIISKL